MLYIVVAVGVAQVLQIMEAYYPEALRTAYVVNAPAVFPIMYNIVKPFISEASKKKIVVLGKTCIHNYNN